MTKTAELLQTPQGDDTYDRRRLRRLTRDEMIRVAQHFARTADAVYLADPQARLDLFMQLMANFILQQLGAADSED